MFEYYFTIKTKKDEPDYRFKQSYQTELPNRVTKQSYQVSLIYKLFAIVFLLFPIFTIQAQLENPNDFRTEDCIKKNAFAEFEDHSEHFQFNGNSPYFLLEYDETSLNSPEGFIEYLNLGDDYRFVLQSSFTYKDKEKIRYKEFFQNREVLPGGVVFGPGPGQGCQPSISAFIYSGMDDLETPNINKEDIDDIVDGIITKSDLVLDHNPENECEFIQLWRVKFINENKCGWAWINASNGEILRKASCGDSYNSAEISNTINRKITSSASEEIVSVSFLDPTVNPGFILITEDMCGANTIDVTSPTTIAASGATLLCPVENSEGNLEYGNENHQMLFEAFMDANVCLDEVEIVFPPSYVIASCPSFSASAIPFVDQTQGVLFNFPFEKTDQKGLDNHYSLDIILHEYGHHFLNNIFLSTTSTDHDIIHEYFADLFALHSTSNGCDNENDWELNFVDGNTIRDFRDIDLEDPCKYFDTENELEGFPHSHAEPLRYLAYTLVEEEGFLTLQDFFDLTVDILSSFPSDGNMSDLGLLYFEEFENLFGECSEEGDLLLGLLKDLCFVDNSMRDCEINFDITSSGTSGTNINSVITCENEGNAIVTIRIGSDDYDPSAKYFWSGLRPEWTINNISGNLPTHARQLRIEFPKYQSYPRTFEICVKAPSLEGQMGCVNITLEDCENNDPKCGEIFDDGGGNLVVEEFESRSIKDILKVNNFVKIYSIDGILISEGFANYQVNQLNNYPSQIFIIKEYNQENELLSITKYFVGNNN